MSMRMYVCVCACVRVLHVPLRSSAVAQVEFELDLVYELGFPIGVAGLPKGGHDHH